MVGEEYYPLGHTQFGSLINKIKLKKPDVIYAIVVGGSNVAFYKQLKAAGITSDKQTLLTISVTEDESARHRRREHRRASTPAMKYFQSLDNDNNKAFVAGLQEEVRRQDRHRRRDPGGLSRALAVEAAVEKAGSFDVDKVAAASPGIELKTRARRLRQGPREPSSVEQAAHRPGASDGQFKVLYEIRADRAQSVPEGLSVNAASALGRTGIAAPVRREAERDTAQIQDAERCSATIRSAISLSILVMQGFTGLSLFSVLLLMALGLAIIFGQMGVINMAHGEFLTIGAYTTYLCSSCSQHSRPGSADVYFLVAIDRRLRRRRRARPAGRVLMIRHLYKRPLDTLLATWGLSLIMQQAFRSIFGAREVGATCRNG